jgi:hypothetical protein
MPRNLRTRTPEEIEQDREAFLQVKQVLASPTRLPMTGGTSKMLHFMLESPEGCDALVSSDIFQIRFGWNPARHRYILGVASSCVSQLLTWAGVSSVHGEVQALLPAAHVPARSFVPWSFSARQLWLREDPSQVVFAIRAGEVSPEGLPWPAPIEEMASTPRWRQIDPPVPCPHCQQFVEHARDVGDALICPHCARSF